MHLMMPCVLLENSPVFAGLFCFGLQLDVARGSPCSRPVAVVVGAA